MNAYDLAVVPGAYPVGSWGFLPVFERNGEIYSGYYTPKSLQHTGIVNVSSCAGSTNYIGFIGMFEICSFRQKIT